MYSGGASVEEMSVLGDVTAVTGISAWNSHTLAIKDSVGTIWSWGYNSDGQLGDGTIATSLTPVKLILRFYLD